MFFDWLFPACMSVGDDTSSGNSVNLVPTWPEYSVSHLSSTVWLNELIFVDSYCVLHVHLHTDDFEILVMTHFLWRDNTATCRRWLKHPLYQSTKRGRLHSEGRRLHTGQRIRKDKTNSATIRSSCYFVLNNNPNEFFSWLDKWFMFISLCCYASSTERCLIIQFCIITGWIMMLT